MTSAPTFSALQVTRARLCQKTAEGVTQVVALGHVGEGQGGPTRMRGAGKYWPGPRLQGPHHSDRGAVDHDEGGAGASASSRSSPCCCQIAPRRPSRRDPWVPRG